MKTNQISFVIIALFYSFSCTGMELWSTEQRQTLELQALEHKKRTTAARKSFERTNFEQTPSKRMPAATKLTTHQQNKRPRIEVVEKKESVKSDSFIQSQQRLLAAIKTEDLNKLSQSYLFDLSVSTVTLLKEFGATNPDELRQKLVTACQQQQLFHIGKKIDEKNSFVFKLQDKSCIVFPNNINEIPDDQEICGIKLL